MATITVGIAQDQSTGQCVGIMGTGKTRSEHVSKGVDESFRGTATIGGENKGTDTSLRHN